MKIAMVQYEIAWEDKEINYKRAEAFLEQAAKQNCDLAVFPEMSFTGFSMKTECTAEKNFETLRRMRQYACDTKTAIGFGWTGQAENGEKKRKAENHYTVIDAGGEILSDYIKIHPFSYSGEDQKFQAGESLSFFETGNMTCCTLICYDLRFPELFQAASKRADLILVPANWPQKRSMHWKILLQARAIENQCYIAGINCVGNMNGLAYSGDSMLIAPDGRIIEQISGKEQMIVAEIENDVVQYRRNFPVKQDRREKLYQRL